jgi:hypothetical protein
MMATSALGGGVGGGYTELSGIVLVPVSAAPAKAMPIANVTATKRTDFDKKILLCYVASRRSND